MPIRFRVRPRRLAKFVPPPGMPDVFWEPPGELPDDGPDPPPPDPRPPHDVPLAPGEPTPHDTSVSWEGPGPTRDDFHRTIFAAPGDLLPHHVYADWLVEHGGHTGAGEFALHALHQFASGQRKAGPDLLADGSPHEPMITVRVLGPAVEQQGFPHTRGWFALAMRHAAPAIGPRKSIRYIAELPPDHAVDLIDSMRGEGVHFYRDADAEHMAHFANREYIPRDIGDWRRMIGRAEWHAPYGHGLAEWLEANHMPTTAAVVRDHVRTRERNNHPQVAGIRTDTALMDQQQPGLYASLFHRHGNVRYIGLTAIGRRRPAVRWWSSHGPETPIELTRSVLSNLRVEGVHLDAAAEGAADRHDHDFPVPMRRRGWLRRFARQDFASLVRVMQENPHDALPRGILADFLEENGLSAAVPFILRKSMDSPSFAGQHRHVGPTTPRDLYFYLARPFHVQMPGHDGSYNQTIGLTHHHDTTAENPLFQVGLGLHSEAHTGDPTEGGEAGPFQSVTWSRFTVPEVRHLADLIQAEPGRYGASSWMAPRQKLPNLHKWLDAHGVPRVPKPRGRRRYARVQYPQQHDVWKQAGMRDAARFLWRIALEGDGGPGESPSQEIATMALLSGDTQHLPLLNEALRSDQHPLADVMNWANVPRAMQLNPRVLHWLLTDERLHRSMYRRLGLYGSDPFNFEGAAQTALHVRGSGMARLQNWMWRSHGFSPEETHAALRRIAYPHATTLRSWGHLFEQDPEVPLVPYHFQFNHEKGDYESTPINDRPLHEHAADPQSPYFLSPYHRFQVPPPTKQPRPPRRPPRGDQPSLFARALNKNQPQGFIDALRRLRSSHQKKRRQIATEVAQALALGPVHARDALHDTADGLAVPGVAVAAYRSPDPETVKYAGAWLGLLTQTNSQAVFHARRAGPDSVLKWHMRGSGDEIRRRLDRGGIHSRILMPHGDGFHILVFDQGRRLRPRLTEFARKHGIVYEETLGKGEVIGGADAVEARDRYRKVIEKYEGGPVGGEQPQQMARRGRPRRFQRDDELDFHRTMSAEPANTLHPLIYADWLDEHERPTTAMHIRQHFIHHRDSGYQGSSDLATGMPRMPFFARLYRGQGGDSVNLRLNTPLTDDPDDDRGGHRWSWNLHFPHTANPKDHRDTVASHLHGLRHEGVALDEDSNRFVDFWLQDLFRDQPPEEPLYEYTRRGRPVRYQHEVQLTASHIAEAPHDRLRSNVLADRLSELGLYGAERVVRKSTARPDLVLPGYDRQPIDYGPQEWPEHWIRGDRVAAMSAHPHGLSAWSYPSEDRSSRHPESGWPIPNPDHTQVALAVLAHGEPGKRHVVQYHTEGMPHAEAYQLLQQLEEDGVHGADHHRRQLGTQLGIEEPGHHDPIIPPEMWHGGTTRWGQEPRTEFCRRGRPVRFAAEDEAGFHHAILANPRNSIHSLVYADWLEDHDRPATATVVRGQGSRQPSKRKGRDTVWELGSASMIQDRVPTYDRPGTWFAGYAMSRKPNRHGIWLTHVPVGSDKTITWHLPDIPRPHILSIIAGLRAEGVSLPKGIEDYINGKPPYASRVTAPNRMDPENRPAPEQMRRRKKRRRRHPKYDRAQPYIEGDFATNGNGTAAAFSRPVRFAAPAGGGDVPPGLTRIAAGGASAHYFVDQDRKNFYKRPKPGHENSLYSEPAATKALGLLGLPVVPAKAVNIGGHDLIQSPHLGNFDHLYSAVRAGFGDQLIPDPSTAARYALGTYLINAADRHGGNYAVTRSPGGRPLQVMGLDYGDSFHPKAGGWGARTVHPNQDSEWLELARVRPHFDIPLPHADIDHVLSHAPAIRQLVQEGTAGLHPKYQNQALEMFDRKVQLIQNLRNHPNPTVRNLPVWNGVVEEGGRNDVPNPKVTWSGDRLRSSS